MIEWIMIHNDGQVPWDHRSRGFVLELVLIFRQQSAEFSMI